MQFHPEVQALFGARQHNITGLFEEYLAELSPQIKTDSWVEALAALDSDFANFATVLESNTTERFEFEATTEIYLLLEDYLSRRGLWSAKVRWGQMLREWGLERSSHIDARLLNCLASGYCELSDYENALPLFWQLIAVLQKDETRQETLARVYNNMGVVHWRLQRLEEAIVLFTHALEIQKVLGNRRTTAMLMMNLSQIYSNQDKFEASLKMSTDALKIAETLNEPPLLTQCYSVQASHLLMNKRYLEAASAYQRAIMGYTVMNDEVGLAEAEFGYALLCYVTSQGTRAKQLIAHCVAIFEQYNHRDLARAYNLQQSIQERYG